MNNIQTEIYDWLHDGARVELNAVGVSFPCVNFTGNRQDVIREMKKCDERKIVIESQLDNEYDKFALIIYKAEYEDGVKPDIGFIPKQSKFSIFLPNRRRPIVLDRGNTDMNTNELFHISNSGLERYDGEVTSFKDYQFKRDGESNIGLSIAFWIPHE